MAVKPETPFVVTVGEEGPNAVALFVYAQDEQHALRLAPEYLRRATDFASFMPRNVRRVGEVGPVSGRAGRL